MLQRGLIALLVLMLVITVVFTSLGVAYSRKDFMSTMLKVEHGLGDTSDKTLELYKKSKIFFENIYNTIDGIIDIKGTYEKVFNGVSRFMSKVNACFSLAQKYGFDFGGKFKKAYSVLFRGFEYDSFWNQNDFNIEDTLKIVGCLVYGEENEYSYSFYNVTHWHISTSGSTVKYGLFHHVTDYDSLVSSDSFGWISSPALTPPTITDPIVKHFMTNEMFVEFLYDDLEVPITGTNIKYRFDDGAVLQPTAFLIRFPSSSRDFSLYGTHDVKNMSLIGNPELYIRINGVSLCVDFVFEHSSFNSGEKDVLRGGDVLHTLYYRDIVTPDDNKSWLENQVYYWKNIFNRFGDYYMKSFGVGACMGGGDF